MEEQTLEGFAKELLKAARNGCGLEINANNNPPDSGWLSDTGLLDHIQNKLRYLVYRAKEKPQEPLEVWIPAYISKGGLGEVVADPSIVEDCPVKLIHFRQVMNSE